MATLVGPNAVHRWFRVVAETLRGLVGGCQEGPGSDGVVGAGGRDRASEEQRPVHGQQFWRGLREVRLQVVRRVVGELYCLAVAARRLERVCNRAKQRPGQHQIASGSGRAEAPVSSDPGEVRFADLRQLHSGELVREAEHPPRVVERVTGHRTHRSLGVRDEARKATGHVPEPRVLVRVPERLQLQLQHVDRRRLNSGARTERRYLPVVHQRCAQGGDGAHAAVAGPRDEGWFGDQVGEGDVEHVGEGLDDGEPVQLDAVVLDLAQPVLGAVDQTGEDLLRHAAPAAVPGDPLADGQGVRHPTHAVSVAPPSELTPEQFSGVKGMDG